MYHRDCDRNSRLSRSSPRRDCTSSIVRRASAPGSRFSRTAGDPTRRDVRACLNVPRRAVHDPRVPCTRAGWGGIDLFGRRDVWLLTELEHASKHSNGAAYAERTKGGKRAGAKGRREGRGDEGRVCDEIGRAIGRSAPGKRIRCNRPELSSRARRSLRRGGRLGLRDGFLLRILSRRRGNVRPVAKDWRNPGRFVRHRPHKKDFGPGIRSPLFESESLSTTFDNARSYSL